jgi:hypothetical protein
MSIGSGERGFDSVKTQEERPCASRVEVGVCPLYPPLADGPGCVSQAREVFRVPGESSLEPWRGEQAPRLSSHSCWCENPFSHPFPRDSHPVDRRKGVRGKGRTGRLTASAYAEPVNDGRDSRSRGETQLTGRETGPTRVRRPQGQPTPSSAACQRGCLPKRRGIMPVRARPDKRDQMPVGAPAPHIPAARGRGPLRLLLAAPLWVRNVRKAAVGQEL